MNASIEIFRAGTHTDMSGNTLTFAVRDLAATAAAYDPSVYEAPLVVGHPATADPAYGWVHALDVQDDRLRATPHQIEPSFAELVRGGRYKKISASFWRPDAPNNPTPGVYALRHVGFLGAAAPAVTGLRSPQFAADPDPEHVITLEFAQPGEETASMPDPAVLTPPATPPSAPTVDYAARTAQLEAENAQLTAQLTARAAELAAERQRQARAQAVAYAETHVQAGRVLPRQQAGLTELLLTLPDAPLSFADPAGQTVQIGPRAWLEQFLADLPAQIDFAERSAPAAAPPASNDAMTAQFAASPALQAEFGDVETYRAYHAAAASGRATILGSKA